MNKTETDGLIEALIKLPPEVRLATQIFIPELFAWCKSHNAFPPQSVITDLCGRSFMAALGKMKILTLQMGEEEKTGVLEPYIREFAAGVMNLGLRLFELAYLIEKQKTFALRSAYSRASDHLSGDGIAIQILAAATYDPRARVWPYGAAPGEKTARASANFEKF